MMSTTSCTVVAGRQVPVCFIVGHPSLPWTAGHGGHPPATGTEGCSVLWEGSPAHQGYSAEPPTQRLVDCL